MKAGSLTLSLAIVLWTHGAAQAAFVTLGGTVLPGQGVVTAQPLALEERFEGPGFPSTGFYTPPQPAAPGYRTVAGNLLNEYSSPAPDSNGYIAVGNNASPQRVSFGLNGEFRYVGFHWGSIDEYNIVQFFDKEGRPIFFDGFGTEISGLALAEFFEIPLYTSEYVNFSFFRSPLPVQVDFFSRTTSFEFDNLAVAAASIPSASSVFDPAIDAQFGDPVWNNLPGRRPEPFADVPAPAGVALFGLAGLALLVGRARRKG
jgi:hypothetical protein